MENLYVDLLPATQVVARVDALLTDKYGLNNGAERTRSLIRLRELMQVARPGLTACIEYPYVDKLYRNEYYHYYSSKLYSYSRDCIRISFFDADVQHSDFRDAGREDFLREHYLGFLVVRPTFPAIIGRNVLHPAFFKNPEIEAVCTRYPASVNGVKLTAHGFPHASQDAEMMVCAETTIWSVMEYFSHRYPEYRPVKPDEIHRVLGKHSAQRLIPSKGLNLHEICFALKSLGFGMRIYSADSYDDFDSILKMYVESGIPVIAAIENLATGIAHVVNVIGRTTAKSEDLAGITSEELHHSCSISNYYDLCKEYVFIDDNHPAYRVAPLEEPALHYNDTRWAGCTVTNFIVPLYPKIYLEADRAAELAKHFFQQLNALPNLRAGAGARYLLRTMLMSSRSFKHIVAHNTTLDATVKESLLYLSMPKFVWITELIKDTDYPHDMASGMILFDATEKRENEFLAFFLGSVYLSPVAGQIKAINNLNLHPFSSFHNLKTY